MYTFPIVAKVVVKLTRSNLDNIVDRAHYFFTFAVLVLCALLNAGELLFGSPIMCQDPMEYSTEWGYFVNEYCFINGTYVGEDGGYMPDSSHPGKVDVSYYQVSHLITATLLSLLLSSLCLSVVRLRAIPAVSDVLRSSLHLVFSPGSGR